MRVDAPRREAVRVAEFAWTTEGAAWLVQYCEALRERGYDVRAMIERARRGTAE
jgi:hypothetical protein